MILLIRLFIYKRLYNKWKIISQDKIDIANALQLDQPPIYGPESEEWLLLYKQAVNNVKLPNSKFIRYSNKYIKALKDI